MTKLTGDRHPCQVRLRNASTLRHPSPLLGALLRMPLDVIQRRIVDALHEHGFDDLVAAHLSILRWPGPRRRTSG